MEISGKLMRIRMCVCERERDRERGMPRKEYLFTNQLIFICLRSGQCTNAPFDRDYYPKRTDTAGWAEKVRKGKGKRNLGSGADSATKGPFWRILNRHDSPPENPWLFALPLFYCFWYALHKKSVFEPGPQNGKFFDHLFSPSPSAPFAFL